MRAYEIATKVTPEGTLELPKRLLENLPRGEALRLIVLISEPDDSDELAWSQLAADQFFAGYAEADAVYDTVG